MQKVKALGIVVGVCAITVVGLWITLDAVLASQRGLELTDEGLYLLAAREIAGASQWGFPFGWHTAPLYELVGGDVAAFRTLGAVILCGAGALFGFSAFLAAHGPQSLRSVSQSNLTLQAVVFTAVGLFGPLFYYSSLNRAPSYNWVSLVGLLTASAGFFFFLWFVTTGAKKSWSFQAHGSLALTSLGLIFTVVAKPTSPILFVFAALIVLWGLTNRRTGVIFVLEVGAFSLAFLVVFVAAGLWPINFLTSFVTPLDRPPLLPGHSLTGAVYALSVFPLELGVSIVQRSVLGAVLLVAAAGAFLLSKWLYSGAIFLVPLSYTLGLLSALSIFGLWESILSSSEPVQASSSRGAYLAVLTLLALSAVVAWKLRHSASQTSNRVRVRVGVALISSWVPFVFAFGSGNGIIEQSRFAVVGFLVAIFVLLLDIRGALRPTMIWVPIFLTVIIMLVVTLADGHRAPYRMQSMANQTQEITLNDTGQSKVRVDSETAEIFQGLRDLLERSGYEAGDPIVGLVWRWNATWPYALGAEVPPGLMPTLWGYENSPALLDDTVRIGRNQGFDFGEAWWLVSDPDTLARADSDALEAAYDRILEGEKMSFPADFDRVGEVGGIEVYRPRNSLTPGWAR